MGVLDETGPASRPNQRLCFLRFQCPHGRSRLSLCAMVFLLLSFKTSSFFASQQLKMLEKKSVDIKAKTDG